MNRTDIDRCLLAASTAVSLLNRVASASRLRWKTKNVVFVCTAWFADGSVLVEGHRPLAAEGRELHQRAKPSDLAA